MRTAQDAAVRMMSSSVPQKWPGDSGIATTGFSSWPVLPTILCAPHLSAADCSRLVLSFSFWVQFLHFCIFLSVFLSFLQLVSDWGIVVGVVVFSIFWTLPPCQHIISWNHTKVIRFGNNYHSKDMTSASKVQNKLVKIQLIRVLLDFWILSFLMEQLFFLVLILVLY